MSVFTSQIRYRPWLGQVTLLATVLGALLALSLKTQDRIRTEQLPNMRPNQLASAYAALRDQANDQRKTIADLRKRLETFQAAAAAGSPVAKELQKENRETKILAGLVAVTGPGVVVTLRDSKKLPPKSTDMSPEDYEAISRQFRIHDSDIQTVVNELRAAGAEAIAVNDQRVTSFTAIRCVGPVVQVNGLATSASPVKIKAIGDPDAMMSGMSMPDGARDQFRMVDPDMFSIDKGESLLVPAYSGATPLRYARPAPEAKAETAQRMSEAATNAGDAAISDGAGRKP